MGWFGVQEFWGGRLASKVWVGWFGCNLGVLGVTACIGLQGFTMLSVPGSGGVVLGLGFRAKGFKSMARG